MAYKLRAPHSMAQTDKVKTALQRGTPALTLPVIRRPIQSSS